MTSSRSPGDSAATGPVVVVCALEIERRALAGLERPGIEIHTSGIGPDAASELAERLCERPMRALISAGYCGALRPGLRPGEVIVAEQVKHENTGAAFAADDLLLAAAEGRRGVLVSTSEVARTPADRAALTGLAVDMESASLARAAREAGIPFLAVRAVSDRFRDRVPDLTGVIDHLGRPDLRRLLGFVARHPREIPRLIRLGRSARAAGRAMSNALETLFARLGV